jgi:hypothetical protein
MNNVWVIERLRRGGFRCYEITTLGDGSFEVSKPIVLQNALLFLDGECIELAEHAEDSRQSADASSDCPAAGGDEAEPDDSGVALTKDY